MKHSPHLIQINAHTRASPFAQFSSEGDEQFLNIRPQDV
jgi:hypothetical protein